MKRNSINLVVLALTLFCFILDEKGGKSMQIRSIKETDYPAVRKLIIEAFTQSEHGYHDEADLVDKIRLDDAYDHELELVAIVADEIVGHGLLSEIKIINEQATHTGLALAPLAVLPEKQKQGIGSEILTELEQHAIQKGYRCITILGDPEYYGRLSYTQAKNWNISFPFEVSDAYCLIKELQSNALQNVSGEVKYLAAFD